MTLVGIVFIVAVLATFVGFIAEGVTLALWFRAARALRAIGWPVKRLTETQGEIVGRLLRQQSWLDRADSIALWTRRRFVAIAGLALAAAALPPLF